MLPVLTFASGLIAGALGVQLLKKARLSDGGGAAGRLDSRLDKAQSGLRQAAVSGLTAMEASSASLRAKLTPAADAAPPADEAAAPVDGEASATGPATAREPNA